MFENIVLRRSDTGVALTLGEIAEALLFYQNVHLVLDPQALKSLTACLGIEELLALIARKRLTAVYAEDMLMEHHNNEGPIQRHNFVSGMLSGMPNEPKGKIRKSRRERLELQLVLNGHSRGEGRRLADRFIELIPIKQQASDYFVAGGIPKSATADLADAKYAAEAIRRVLCNQIGFESAADNLKVDIFPSPDGFVFRSNIDFNAANASRRAINPALEDVTEGSVLVALLDANADVNIAAFYGGDFYTSSMNSEIVQVRFAELLRRTGISSGQLQQFKEIVLGDYPRLREVINSKERSFKEFELLLDQSDRWRRTVNQLGPDANLVTEYFKQASQEGWISGLTAKTIRFVIGLGMGAKNPIASAAWSLADTFMMDKLKGWRPNHFVDEKLKPFLDNDSLKR